MQITYTIDCHTASIELPTGSTVTTLFEKLHLTAPELACAITINNTPKDLHTELKEGDILEIYHFNHSKGQEVFWHTSAHVLAQAVLRLFPNAQPTIGPPIENGFYYDFADLHISEADLDRIEEEMQKIVSENFKPVMTLFSSKEEALNVFSKNKYKKELIEELPENQPITGYKQGEFFDLCRGPHLLSLGKIKALKILKTSGAYWRGDQKREMLTRIYGISFPDRKLLKEYLHKIEEAKKRDHKILGPKLDLFSLHEEAPGMPFIHPNGMHIWNILLSYWRECHAKAGYKEIKTPSMMIKELWERSGHWAHYKQNMYLSEIEGREFAIKPMNCPGAMLHYRCHKHSYREFPLRVAELGHVHRYESSGSLSGLFRVRSFHQDDAHIFIEASGIEQEITELLNLVDEIYTTFGLTYELALSTRPENSIGTDAEWEQAVNGLKKALEKSKRPFIIKEGDGAFYGPKIDLHIHDALGRSWQCGTIQLDMFLPERFDLTYTDSTGERKRPVMLHRAIYGSIERFFGSLIEFYKGKFPLWLSPRQIVIIPVSDKHKEYAEAIAKELIQHGFLVDVDDANESVAKKIRESQLAQYNYILTLGDAEMEHSTINLRTRDNVVHGEMSPKSFLEEILTEQKNRSLASPFCKKE